MSENIRLSAVKYGADGLVPVVTQESRSGDILMVAYANRDALDRRLSTGLAHYFSRSRGTLWQKGETSGHVQQGEQIRLDCDGDAVLCRARQAGTTCHLERARASPGRSAGLEGNGRAHTEDDERLASEAADLLYHLLVLLQIRGVPLDSVRQELEKRKR